MTKLLNQLVYVELGSPDPAASVAFFTRKLGMRVVHTDGDKTYLRHWGDYYTYSLIISPAEDACLKTMAWRTESAEALEEAVGRIEAEGSHVGEWSESDFGRGRAYGFTGPYGHHMSLLWDIEFFHAEPEFASAYPDRPEKRSSHGAAARFTDHVTIAASDVDGFAKWYSEILGFRIMATTTLEHAPITVFGVLTTNEKSHDLGIVVDTSSTPGRIHHLAFWVDHPEDLVRIADLMIENGTPIEFGPSIHGIGEQHFLYFREPSRLRIEMNSGGYRNYVPDWKYNVWKPSEGSNSFFRNLDLPDSMLEAFPAAEGRTATEQGVTPELAEELANPWANTSGTH